MNWYLGICATAFVAGLGWRAAMFLWDALESFIIPDEEDTYDHGR